MTMEYLERRAREYREIEASRVAAHQRPRTVAGELRSFGVLLRVVLLRTPEGEPTGMSLIEMHRRDQSRPGELYYCGKLSANAEKLHELIGILQDAHATLTKAKAAAAAVKAARAKR